MSRQHKTYHSAPELVKTGALTHCFKMIPAFKPVSIITNLHTDLSEICFKNRWFNRTGCNTLLNYLRRNKMCFMIYS